MTLLENLGAKEWLELNAKLQKKKSNVRKKLKEIGILKKGGNNAFDKYTYFSEAQYKQLFTSLFSDNGLEMKFSELEYATFEGTEKQANGRMPKLEFSLFDVDTGFFETTVITGEGIDKGDKAGYKAYTGALKYFLADTFMVATGDDPEAESPNNKMNSKVQKNDVLVCAKCHNAVTGTEGKDGKFIPAEEIAKLAKEKTGKVLCADCLKEGSK